MAEIKQAFEQRVIAIPLEQILPSRKVEHLIAGSKKYACILSSIKELGVIEPLVVHPKQVIADGISSFMLLDGHLRLEALKSLGATEALCLISTDDEGFTYNRQPIVIVVRDHFRPNANNIARLENDPNRLVNAQPQRLENVLDRQSICKTLLNLLTSSTHREDGRTENRSR